ncbi:peptidoglycan DD-metalloendopeptidase family protein [Dinghuibacter silviterrae]|uniref:Peptidase M23-like protein n=1 Tax=Dinghuibacter silviterrae TaxID=1539049 RepID=A0A4R8DRW3_9BACT|nr:peptidoglycan DD-metalloendopeptidase family protein [Dinghuibacter silviterrae]TDX00165.1 peptidase M23-like protein [Dinghuibacter silviterrae]
MNPKPLETFQRALEAGFQPVVPFHPGVDRISPLDLSAANVDLTDSVYDDLDKFNAFIEETRVRSGARYLVGGYGELRKIYGISPLFDEALRDGAAAAEPRRFHLGIDIWGPAGTPVYVPVAGRIHSLAWNGARGDYGGTIILEHGLLEYGSPGQGSPGAHWYSLYGHLSKASLEGKREDDVFTAGAELAAFGEPAENGWWPPHLHLQVILDLQGMKGDYPGVCRYSERESYLRNCPNPVGLLTFMRS